MNTKNTLRTNLEALHLSTKPPTHQAQPKATKTNKKPRVTPAAGRTPKKRATPVRPAPKGGDGDEGGEGGDGDDADPGEGMALLADNAGPGEGMALLADNAGPGEGMALLADDAGPGKGTTPVADDADPGEGTAPVAGGPEGVVAFAGEPKGAVDLAVGPEGAAAVARVQADLDALPRDEVRRISVHVPTAAAIALGALPRLLRLRDAIVALPGHPPDALAKLRDYALAASYAHALAQPRGEDETHLRELLREAMPLRERLLRGAEALAQFGLADATRVASIRRGTGYLDAAQDLTALGALFRELWPAVASQTPITRPEVERAAALGGLLLEALEQRTQGTDGSADPREAEERLGKAYELLARAYSECRHAVLYLRRHEGDADRIAPPLGTSRRRARRPSPDEPDAPAPAPAPAPAEPSDGEGEADEG